MATDTQHRVHDLLAQMPKRGMQAAKQLFWSELNYDQVNQTLSRRNWPERATDALAADPVLLAHHQSQFGAFEIMYAPLAEDQVGRAFPLSLTAERLAVTQLLKDHPYALFLFSDTDEEHWHLVNVKLDKAPADETEKEDGRPDTRRLFRRIAVGPYERLRTASERVAMLDLATLSPDLFGLSPLAIQQRHDEAFDVEAVTKGFFQRFARLFYQVRDEIAQDRGLKDDANDHAQMLLDRLLFLYFIQKKGWLAQDPDYLYNRFCDGHARRPDETSYYGEVVYPLFLALSDRGTNQELAEGLGPVPFLNGGLFELHLASSGRTAAQARLPVSNRTFQALFEELLEHYNFSISEDTPLDQEVAIDPEMLGKIFESLVLEREQDPDVDLRRATGSYYTPRPVVAFMCREALTEYLAGESDVEREQIAHLLDLPPAERLSDEERAWLGQSLSRDQAKGLKASLLDVRACDPAVGSGAFLMGLLQAITWGVGLLDWRVGGDQALARRNYTYDLKKRAIERCLYGVDIQAQAVQICELRLWLSLVVDYELPEGVPFDKAVRQVPALPNLAYKVRQGDSLLERLFGQVVQLDTLARDQATLDLIEDLQKEKAAYFTLADTPEKRGRELRILELQTALAERLVEAQRESLGGYQPSLLGDETARERREREAFEARQREYDELKERVEKARQRVERLRRQGDTKGLGADALRRQLLGDPEHPTFLWRVDFAEVYQRQGGFDVMIANPPYVRQEKIKHLKQDLKQVYPQVYHGVADIYVYFYAQGLRQLHHDGALVYISSNKFMRAGYGKTLRRLLGQDVTLRTVIDFGDLPVFEATTYPTVLVMHKHPPAEGHALQVLTVDDIAVVDRLAETVKREAWPQPQDSLRPDGWALVKPDVQALLEKLRHNGIPLGEYADGQFNMGIKTGLNKAFVIDEKTRRQLVGEDPRSEELIKPWLRGRNVKRWQVDWEGLYLIAIQNSDDADAQNAWAREKTEAVARKVFADSYPAIYEHLSQFESRLRSRTDQGKFWWELRACAYYAEFAKPKILYPDIAKRCEFAFDQQGFLNGNTTYFIPLADMVLLGILNSRAVEFFYNQISAMIQRDYLRFFSQYLAQIPIPDTSKSQRAAIEGFVEYLLYLNAQPFYKSQSLSHARDHVMGSYFEQILNGLVYELYFPEELHAVGKHILQLVLAAEFPRLDAIQGDKLTVLRAIFERTFDKNHPLRKTLFFLDSLEPIKIIEGKQ